MRQGVLRVAVVSPQEVVMRGLTTMLADYPDRLVVTALPSVRSKAPGVDVILYDTLGLHLSDGSDLVHLLQETDANVLIFSRDMRPDLRVKAYSLGAKAWVSMSVHAGELVRAIEMTASGEPIGEREDRLGTVAGLTTREVEVLALITQGLSNADIAEKLVVSVNTLKSHIRQAYRKIQVTTRSQAVSWAITHGFAPPDENSVESGASVGARMVTDSVSTEQSG
ncbi:response regulator transcription factor [Nocardioides luteus]|uniref:response regulator transcription factor n=1 Tax=Nocardioides luteus TaxID=1844 RepID=UPI001A2A6D5D|nr:response regulator transcription factor [Nocardioides luteus]MBG6097239.1 DNA-binding NarL/FixJ family response regulator [Nocardioides luteus]